MRLSKLQMFFVLNGTIALFLLVYMGIWISGNKTRARIITPYSGTRLTAVYHAGEQQFTAAYMRYDVERGSSSVTITYLPFHPSSSRIYSFMGIALEPLGWWFVFFLASSMLLLTNNFVFSRGTVFILQRKFPWIWMEEFFRLPWYHSKYKEDKDDSGIRRPGVKKLDNLL